MGSPYFRIKIKPRAAASKMLWGTFSFLLYIRNIITPVIKTEERRIADPDTYVVWAKDSMVVKINAIQVGRVPDRIFCMK